MSDEVLKPSLTDELVKQMVARFLCWRLPEHFHPDAGISFKPTFNDHMDPPMRHNPTGTNLFDADQAEAMVRYMLGGFEVEQARTPRPVSEEMVDKLRVAFERTTGLPLTADAARAILKALEG